MRPKIPAFIIFSNPYFFLWALFVALCLALGQDLFGAQRAMVISGTGPAVIYADPELSAPIGVIKEGKEIIIGSVAKRNGTVFPLIVSNKVAYIESKYLILNEFKVDQQKKLSEHSYYNVEQQVIEDNLAKNNHLTFQLHTLASGNEWKQLSQSAGDTAEDLTGFVALFEHRSPEKKYHWGAGLGYYAINQTRSYFKTLTVEGKAHYLAFHGNYFSIDFGGGILLSGDARAMVQGAENEAQGALWGYQMSAQAKLLPFSKISLMSGIEYKKMNFAGLNKIEIPGSDKKELKSIGGLGFYVGLSYKF